MNTSTAPFVPMELFADRDLLAAIIEKDEHALATVYDRHAPLCYNIAYRIANDHGAADSILQDAFLKVWNKAGHYNGRGSVAGWIVRITRNSALDWLRHRRLRADKIAYSLDDDQANTARDIVSADERANPEARFTTQEMRRALRSALAQLPGDQRRVVELSFFDGFTHQAIADMTGVPLGTIKTRVRLGLQKLRVHLSAIPL